MNLLQKLGFGAIVFGIGCASSLWLESNESSNPFFSGGNQYASPVGLPSRESSEIRQVRQQIERLRLETSQSNLGR